MGVVTTDDNYTLNCESNQELDVNLDSGISINEDKKIILLITFNNPNGTDSKIRPDKSESKKGIKYYKTSNGKLGAGSIVLIILLPLLAIIAVIATIFLTKKSSPVPEANIDGGNSISSFPVNK